MKRGAKGGKQNSKEYCKESSKKHGEDTAATSPWLSLLHIWRFGIRADPIGLALAFAVIFSGSFTMLATPVMVGNIVNTVASNAARADEKTCDAFTPRPMNGHSALSAGLKSSFDFGGALSPFVQSDQDPAIALTAHDELRDEVCRLMWLIFLNALLTMIQVIILRRYIPIRVLSFSSTAETKLPVSLLRFPQNPYEQMREPNFR